MVLHPRSPRSSRDSLLPFPNASLAATDFKGRVDGYLPEVGSTRSRYVVGHLLVVAIVDATDNLNLCGCWDGCPCHYEDSSGHLLVPLSSLSKERPIPKVQSVITMEVIHCLDKTCEMRLISDNDLLSMLHFLEKVVRESLLLLDVWPIEIYYLGYCALVILVSQNT